MDSKIKNETHRLVIYNIPEILEGTPAESRTHDTKAISDVYERILASSESAEAVGEPLHTEPAEALSRTSEQASTPFLVPLRCGI